MLTINWRWGAGRVEVGIPIRLLQSLRSDVSDDGGDEKWLDPRSVLSQEEFLMNVLYERKREVKNGSEICDLCSWKDGGAIN